MSDLISRQAAIDAVSKGCQELRGVFSRCEENILALPSAQPERKTGRWIQTEELWTDMYTAKEQGIYECSRCGEKVIGKPDWRFCPNCGAEMREGEDG